MQRRRGTLLFILFFLLLAPLFGDDLGKSAGNAAGPPATPSKRGTAAGQANQQSSVSLPNYFYKRFEGTIGEHHHVIVNLMKLGSSAGGDYYSTAAGGPLFFGYGSSVGKHGEVHLEVQGALDLPTADSIAGVFEGHFVSPSEITGVWSSSKSSTVKKSFDLKESYSSGARHFDMIHASKGYYDQGQGSAAIEYTFPVMRSLGDSTASAFNSYQESNMASLYENGVNEAPPSTVDDAMQQFLSLFRQQLDSSQSSDRTYYPPWTYQVSSNILLNRNGILSLENIAFSFEGGAHPNTNYEYASYDVKTGLLLSLSDLLRPNTTGQLNAIALDLFRKEHDIGAGKSLEDAGYFVKDADFKLNSNFIVMSTGLLFRFNQYEIAPYAWGAPRLFIPYSDIRGLLRSSSPISGLLAAAGRGSYSSAP